MQPRGSLALATRGIVEWKGSLLLAVLRSLNTWILFHLQNQRLGFRTRSQKLGHWIEPWSKIGLILVFACSSDLIRGLVLYSMWLHAPQGLRLGLKILVSWVRLWSYSWVVWFLKDFKTQSTCMCIHTYIITWISELTFNGKSCRCMHSLICSLL